MRWHFYDESGVIVSRTIGGADLAMAQANAPAGCTPIKGTFDRLSQQVDVASGKVVEYQPPQPDDQHEWNEHSRRWVKRAEVVAREAKDRAARAALDEIDRRSVRAVRELLAKTAPQIAAIEAEADELRKDVIKTVDEKAGTSGRP